MASLNNHCRGIRIIIPFHTAPKDNITGAGAVSGCRVSAFAKAKDANSDEYNSADHKYVIRFEKGQLPPAEPSGR